MKKFKGFKESVVLMLLVMPMIFLVFPSENACAATWAKTYGGNDLDGAYSVQQTSDGGYIVAGFTWSFRSPDGGYYPDAWVLKLDMSGNIAWQKIYGGSNSEIVFSVQQTLDGGYIAVGGTDFQANPDALILKLDSDGNIQWQKAYGGSSYDVAYSIKQTADGGYIAALHSGSFIGRPDTEDTDIWIIKLNSEGEMQWQKKYDGVLRNAIEDSILPTPDAGYVMLTDSSGGPSLLKLNAEGIGEWRNTYQYPSSSFARSVALAQDGGYVLLSNIWFDYGNSDAGVLKLDRNGNIEWQKAYGGSSIEVPYAIQQTSDGGYIIAGLATSFGTGGTAYVGWIIKLDSNGDIEWQKTYGNSSYYNDIRAIRQTSDGGYVATGESCLMDPGCGIWTLKLDSKGNIYGCPSGLIRSSDAVVVHTTALVSTMPLIGQDTAASPMASNVPAVDTNVIPKEVCLDVLPPVITVTATPQILTPPNRKMVDVRIDGSATDAESGIATVVIAVIDEYGKYNMLVPQFGSTIQLEAWRAGTDKDGRTYTITVVATDMAGNQSTAQTKVVVPKQGHAHQEERKAGP